MDGFAISHGILLDYPVGTQNEFIGFYHRPGTGDSYNLAINSNGSFRWQLDGCDYGAGGDGLWRMDGDTLILYPRGDSGFRWSLESMIGEVREVQIKREGDGISTWAPKSGGKQVSWVPGLVCAQCEGAFVGPVHELFTRLGQMSRGQLVAIREIIRLGNTA